MAGFDVTYVIRLVQDFMGPAMKAAQGAKEAAAAITGMGEAAVKIEGQMGGLAGSMKAVGEAAQAMAGGVRKTGRVFQEQTAWVKSADRASQSYYDQMARVEKKELSMMETAQARKNLQEKGILPKRGEGVGMMGGMFALSMLHNSGLESWKELDNQIRMVRGLMAGTITDEQFADLKKGAMNVGKGTIFGPEAIAEIFRAQAGSGLPIAMKGKDGRTVGEVIANQMLGIASATGEKPEETFQTHLKIARGFGVTDEQMSERFPHISDTIALLAQKSGISMKQAQVQMGNVAGTARAAGWTEDQTAAALQVLQRHGVGQFAGVGMRRIVEQATKSWSKQAKEGWDRLHITQDQLKDAKTGGVITPQALAHLLEDRTKGMSAFDVQKTLAQIFGSKAMAVGNQLVGSSGELDAATLAMQNVKGLAEKFGLESSKGGAAGLMAFSAAWEHLKTAIGESGFGDHVGALAAQFGKLFDSISGGPDWGKEVAGGAMLAMNGLSALALPLMAIHAIAPSLLTVAGALRAISVVTGIGAALFIGYEIVHNWDAIASAAERLWGAIKQLAHGDTSGFHKLGESLGKALNFSGKDVALEGFRYNAKHTGKWNSTLDFDDAARVAMAMQHAKEVLADVKNKVAGYHNPQTQVPWDWDGSMYQGKQSSATGIAKGAHEAQAQKVQVESKVTVDPIHLNPTTAKVDVNVHVDASGVGKGTGTGTMPLSATAARGQTMSDHVGPRVSA